MSTRRNGRRRPDFIHRSRRGSVLIVALLLAAAVGISLVSYLKLSTTSLKLSHRSFFADVAANLVETGLEEAIWSFNQMAAGSSVASVWSSGNGWTTSTSSVAGVIVTSGGTGYPSAPTLSFSGGGGSGATATAMISGGAVTAIQLTNRGTGYTGSPSVSFSGGGGTGAIATATNASATRTLPTFNLDQNGIGIVKVFVAGYDYNYATPMIVAQATITPFDGSAPMVKIATVSVKWVGFWANGIVAKSGITWNGHPKADSWISNAAGSTTGPWAAYPGTGVRSNTTVADYSGSVDLGSGGYVAGNLALKTGVSYAGSGTVTGATTYDLGYFYSMPTFPTVASLDNYVNLGSTVPSTLPRAGDLPNSTDGRYYYFATGAAITTTITAGKNVTIVGSAGTSMAGTNTVPSDGSLTVYMDGGLSGTLVNNSWSGALQIFTSTTTSITINGNDNVRCCLFAPNSDFTGNGGGSTGDFYGSIVAKTVTSNGHMDFHYDETLKMNAKTWSLSMWRQLQSATDRSLYATQLASF